MLDTVNFTRLEEILEAAETEAPQHGLLMMVHGQAGVGKTDFAGNFPDPVFLTKEQGIYFRVNDGTVSSTTKIIDTFETFPEFIGILDYIYDQITAGKFAGRTVVIDTLTAIQQMLFEYVAEKSFINPETGEPDWTEKGFFSYQKGPRIASNRYWPEAMKRFKAIARTGVNVILLAHSKSRMIDLADVPPHERMVPNLDKEILDITMVDCQAVLHYHFDISVDQKAGSIGKKKIGRENGRWLTTEFSPSIEAKNWLSLPPLIEGGESGTECYKNFCSALGYSPHDRYPTGSETPKPKTKATKKRTVRKRRTK